nr:WRKY transcription factor WRKY24-like [Ipomoea batatas]
MSSSFTDLLASDAYSGGSVSRGLGDRIAERTGSGVPKFKSLPPPSLPLSSPAVSPSSYFAFPPGLSPVSSWIPCSSIFLKHFAVSDDWDFFLLRPSTGRMILTHPRKMLSKKRKDTQISLSRPTLLQWCNNGGSYSEYNNQCCPPSQTLREQKRSDDGYNWRKYGQKQVKGAKNPRSLLQVYAPELPHEEEGRRGFGWAITEIVYKGAHNHPKPQSTRRSSSSAASSASTLAAQSIMRLPVNVPDQSYWSNGNGQMDSVATPENSSISVGDDEFEQSFSEEGVRGRRESGKRKRGVSAQGSRTMEKIWPESCEGNPNPRKLLQMHEPRLSGEETRGKSFTRYPLVITTYEGKHNHDVPAARGVAATASTGAPILTTMRPWPWDRAVLGTRDLGTDERLREPNPGQRVSRGPRRSPRDDLFPGDIASLMIQYTLKLICS